MLISVVVPVYNVEKYLRECLDSLVGQTYKDIEVIMVDDGSKDSSGQICEEYASKYHNFKVIHKENAGLGMARNTGIENVLGDYVMFLDSDDYIEEDFVEVLYKELVRNNVDMCKAGFTRITDDKEILKVIKYDDAVYENEKARTELFPRMIGASVDKHDSIEMSACAVLYNVKPIKENNIRFVSERSLISEDLVFNMDYLQKANGACTISSVGYKYRMNLSSLTTGYRKDRFEACKTFYLEIEKRLQELQYDANAFLRLKRMFFIYIKMCIIQETKRVSGKSAKECKNKIKTVCNDVVVRQTIETYPVNRLGFKQRLFLSLIQHKLIFLLYIMAEAKLIK